MSFLERLLGGSPGAILLKLVFLSLVAGAIMAGLGLTPANLFQRLLHAVHALFGLGFGTVRDLGRYILTGAIIVVPIWLIVRLAGVRR